MGEVYRADDLKLAQPVALKFLPAEVDHDPARLMQLHSEVRMARQVSHPNVCRVYDIDEVDGHTFLSMEYVDGEELGSLLRRIGRFPVERALEMARQISAGLAAAHERGVIHRDLKPANVMLDGAGKVRITDFGLAGATGETVRAGTPAYMAPEQLAGSEVTAQSDIYALGLVLYELFTGQRAIEAKNVADLVRKREAGILPPSQIVRDLDPAIDRAILRCLERDPAERPSSALGVAAALPGGDPLAAALAAGETPSPEMVAAAGSTSALKPLTALTGLAVTLALPGGVRRDVGSSPADWQRSARKASGSSRRSRTGGRAHARLCRRAGGLGVRVRFVWRLFALRQAAAGRGRDAGAAPKRQAPRADLLVSQQPAAADPGGGQRRRLAQRPAARRHQHADGPARLVRPSRRVRGGAATARRAAARGPGEHGVAGHSSTRRSGHHEAQARHALVDAAHLCGRAGRVGRPDARLAGAADPRRGRSVPRPPRVFEDGEPVDAARAHARGAAYPHRAHRPAVHCHRGADRARRRGPGGAPQPAEGPRGPARSAADLGGHLRGYFRRLAAERETRDRRRRRARAPLRRARMVALLRRRGVAALPGARAVRQEVLADNADLLEPLRGGQCPRSTGWPRCADRRVPCGDRAARRHAWRLSFARCSVIRWSRPSCRTSTRCWAPG